MTKRRAALLVIGIVVLLLGIFSGAFGMIVKLANRGDHVGNAGALQGLGDLMAWGLMIGGLVGVVGGLALVVRSAGPRTR